MFEVLLSLVVAVVAGLVGMRVGSVMASRRVREVKERASGESAQLSRRLSDLETDRARMEAILSGMVEGVLVVDGEGRLRLVNNAARRMLNLESHLLGRHYVEAVRQPGVVGQLGAALKGEHRAPIEVPLDAVSAAGGPRIFRAQATPASAEGGAVLVLHDISDLRRVDRVRRDFVANDLRRVDRVRRDFVANVSHELRTPLTAVRGYVEALMEEPIEPAQRLKFLEVIDRHTGRMERLVRDLLRLARLDAQQETADVRAIDVAALFRSVSTDLSERIERQQPQVDIKVDAAAAVIDADPTKMHDALRNLVENAVNYSAEGGRIELEARLDGDRALLSVGDYGPGVPEMDLGRVFERFYRVDKSRTRDPGGTGLGLSIVRHLVELHGGRVTAANRGEGGALFTISLPHNRNR
jgi:two-component system, OmpR family, phosphate regulon sensor histidine kinase PhoR